MIKKNSNNDSTVPLMRRKRFLITQGTLNQLLRVLISRLRSRATTWPAFSHVKKVAGHGRQEIGIRLKEKNRDTKAASLHL